MATKTWVGTDSGNEGDVNTAANWSPSGVPINGDSIIVNGDTTQNMTGSLGTFASFLFPSFFVGPDANIDIGTANDAAGSLRFAATKLVNQGSGTFYYYFASANETAELICNSSNSELAMTWLTGVVNTLTTGVLTSGHVTATGTGLNVTKLFSSFRGAKDTDVRADLTSVAPTVFYMGGGRISIDVPPPTLHLSGGVLTVTGTTGAVQPTIYISGNAKLIYDHILTVALVELRSGTMDLTQRSRELTITLLRRWPGTTLKTNDLVTITATEDMDGGDIGV